MVRLLWILLLSFGITAVSATAQAQDTTTGLVALWKFDETSGTTAADSSGNANNGTYVGGPTLGVSSPRATGAYFPSDNIYMTAPASASLNAVGVSNADFSVAFWVKPASTSGSWRPLFHKGSINFERGPGVWLNSGDNRVYFRVSTTANNDEGATSATYLPTSSWSHVACVKSGNTWLCYINGVLDTQYTLSAGTTGNSGPVYVGDDPWYSGSNAYMDDVRFYSRALTAADIGVLCQMPAANRLLLVVVDSGNLTAQETLRNTAFQNWGYSVTLISETAAQATFDTDAAVNDVAYICETVTASNLGTKITSKSLGIVNANSGMCTNLAIASTCSATSAAAINIDKNQHYITTPWPIGSRTLTSSTQSFLTISGTQAGNILSLGSIGSVSALATVDISGKLNDGTTAAGRRVQLPWGASTFDFASLNSDGQTLLSRALAWAGGTVGYWTLDETSGTTAADSSVNANNGIYTGGPTLGAAAPCGTGVYFPSGNNIYMTAPASASLNAVGLSNADFSVVFWVKPASSSGSWRPLFHKGNASLERGPGVWLNTGDNRVYFRVSTTANSDDGTLSATYLPTGSWSHVACVKSGHTWLCYVNGVLDTQYTLSAGTTGNSGPVYIGDDPWFSGSNAYLDDVRFYNLALGSDEIALLKTSGTSQGVHIIKWVETQ